MKVNQLKAGAILSYVSLALSYIIGIIYTPIMLRLLGQSEYGLYSLVLSIVSYLGLLKFGFGSAYMRYYSRLKISEDQKNIAKLNGMFLIIFLGIGIIALLAGILLVFNVESILGSKITLREVLVAKKLMVILVFNIAVSFPNIIFNTYITANESFIFQKILHLIKIIMDPLLILVVLMMGYGTVGMVIVTTIINIMIEIINMAFCIKKLDMRFTFQSFDIKLMKEMTIFSSYIFINMIVDQINWNVDKFLLGRFNGTISVAVYGLAAQINSYYMSLPTAISNVFTPRVHRMVAATNNNRELTILFTKIGRIQFVLLSLISTGFIFFGQPFISFWVGENYINSYYIILLLIIPATIPLIQTLGLEIQRAKNMHKFRTWVYFFIAIVNVIFSIPLIKLYEGVGAGMGTALALILGNGIAMNWYYHNKINLDMKYFWLQIFKLIPPLLAPVAFGIFVNIFLDLHSILPFLFSGVVYIIIFCLSVWNFGLNKFEKDLIIKPIVG